MLIRPVPFPGELDRSYLGQVMRFNGARDEKEAVALMRTWAGIAGKSPQEVPCIELLSKVAGTALTTFVREHSTLPFRRGITSYLPDLEHGSETNRTLLLHTGMRLARPGAYCCEQCAREDQDFHGQSYWRREHQSPGLFWCPKHGTLLLYIDDESLFMRSPATCLGQAQPITAGWVAEAKGNGAVQRYLDISSGLMDGRRPLDVKTVSVILKEKAREAGFRTTYSGSNGRLLSDHVIDAFGRPWLATVLPALAHKPKGDLSTKLDGVFFLKTSASSVNAYVLASALLFESADIALNALSQTTAKPDSAKGQRRAIPDRQALISAYVKAGGNYATVAELLSADRISVANRLRFAGLPNLEERGTRSLLRAAKAFFIEGQSLKEGTAIGGVTLNAMESMLRLAGRHMETVLRAIDTPSGRGTRIPRMRQRTPLEACEVLELEPAVA